MASKADLFEGVARVGEQVLEGVGRVGVFAGAALAILLEGPDRMQGRLPWTTKARLLFLSGSLTLLTACGSGRLLPTIDIKRATWTPGNPPEVPTVPAAPTDTLVDPSATPSLAPTDTLRPPTQTPVPSPSDSPSPVPTDAPSPSSTMTRERPTRTPTKAPTGTRPAEVVVTQPPTPTTAPTPDGVQPTIPPTTVAGGECNHGAAGPGSYDGQIHWGDYVVGPNSDNVLFTIGYLNQSGVIDHYENTDFNGMVGHISCMYIYQQDGGGLTVIGYIQ